MWILFAVGSSFFAGITSILAKCGIQKTDSDVATAIRTCVVLMFSWILVALTGALTGMELFHQKLNKKSAAGLGLLTLGTLYMI